MKTWIKKKIYVYVGFDPPTYCLRAPSATATLQRHVTSQQVEKSYLYRRVHIKGAERYYWGTGVGGVGGGGGQVALTWDLRPV